MCTQIPQPALPYGFLLCASALLVVLCLPVGSMDPNRHGPDCSSSQSCARRPRRGASPFFWALLGAHLSCPLMAARLPAESGQSPCPATAPACIVPVTLPRRPVPTPCRPSSAGGVAGLRAPVSPAHRFALQDGCRWHGPTLLEQAVRQPGCPAYFLACTLLETLCDHFAPAPPAGGGLPRPPPTTIALADAIPLTRHQAAALELASLLPHSSPPDKFAAGQDWLDNDLHAVLSDHRIPLELRTRFTNFETWQEHAMPRPEHISIYSDGSATSQDPPHSDVSPCSWAFSVWAHCANKILLIGFAAAQAVPCNTPYHLLEVDDTALTGEYLGLAWGLAWVAEFGFRICQDISFHYDAIGAGNGVCGSAAIPKGATYRGLASFCVSLRHYVQTSVRLTHAHVSGHSGQIQNEFVDQLAKQARRQPSDAWDRCLPLWPSRLCHHPHAPWAWATRTTHLDMPTFFSFESEAIRLQRLGKAFTQAPMQGVSEITLHAGAVTFDFSVVTLNVLTLKDPHAKCSREQPAGLRLLGRKGILKHALLPYAPLLVGLQETRLQEDAMQPDPDYYILQAGATEAGVGGCALWVAKSSPYAVSGGRKLYLRDTHLTVVGHSARHLIVMISAPRLSLQVSVLHAPSLAHTPREVVAAFWRDRAADICSRPDGADFVVLVDANARVGSIVTPHVGDLAFETETDSGTLFHDFLIEIEGFLPTTLQEVHEGPSGTWCTPQGVWHRLDYVVLPCHWHSATLTSRVLVDVELLQKREDHLPVWLKCSFCKHLPSETYRDNKKQVVRPALEHRNKPEAEAVFRQVPAVPWHVPIDPHYQALTLGWHNAAAALAPEQPEQPVQAYLSVATLHIVRVRQALRRYLADESREVRRRTCLIVLAAFLLHARHQQFTARAAAVADQWLRAMDVSEAVAIALLRWHGKQLRAAVAQDRRAYLAHLTSNAAQADMRDPRALYKAIRRAFPATKASRSARIIPLPILYRDDGTLASTTEERSTCWRRHFASQECGVDVTPASYLQLANASAASSRAVVFDCSAVPTLFQVEQVVLGLRNNRASGPDGITAEVLKTCAPVTTRQLLPVIVKTVLRLQEPVSWRGGNLMVLAKKSRDPADLRQL